VTAPAFALQEAMRQALLAHGPLSALLGGPHIHDAPPRGVTAPHVSFAEIETRDWSDAGAMAHEHFVTLRVSTNERGRGLAQAIAGEIEAVLDNANLALDGHKLVSLRLVFWTVGRERATEQIGATLRLRAATEPQ